MATDKVALVIGNQDYAHRKLKGLQYPEQDAADVADILTKLQFKVFFVVILLIILNYFQLHNFLLLITF